MKGPCLLLSWIYILLSILNNALVVRSECNFCNDATLTSCISDTEFQQCKNNNEPFGIIYKCNPGYYCSIEGGCTISAELSDCKLCKKCDKTKTFACTGTNSFALCLGGDNPSEITGQCNQNLKCNIRDSKICVDSTPTCSIRDDPLPETTTEAATTTTTTTPSPAQDPKAFCRMIQTEGRYPVGTNPQTTCRQYVSCVKIGTTWYGPIYNCPGETYFDSSANGCVANKPSICGGVVEYLAFRNMLLE